MPLGRRKRGLSPDFDPPPSSRRRNDRLQDSHEIASASAGPSQPATWAPSSQPAHPATWAPSSQPAHPATWTPSPQPAHRATWARSSRSTPATLARSVPDLSLPLHNSTPECRQSQSLIRQSRSENNVVESLQCAATPRPGKQDSRQPPLPQPFPMQQPYNTLRSDSRSVNSGTASFFTGASGFQTGDIHIDASVHTGGGAGDGSIDGWKLLLNNISPNALHDSSARYDAPKCDEDTRVEVTGELMDWIQDRSAPQRILCMTGAAGAGKSALQQTVAERCANADILGGAFFFSSGDPTRNRASTVVGTIAYQLGLKHPPFQSAIVAAVKRDPLIFSRSIQSQMQGLIVLPFEDLRRREEIDLNTFPYVILIDGLDECKGEPIDPSDPAHLDIDDRLEAEDRQAELLAAIRHCSLNSDLPFQFFIASRPELAIRTALEPGGHLHQLAYCIPLSDKYDASGDMNRYLRRRFEDIGLRIGNSQWFAQSDIDTLVEAASGQFIYVATVYRYISNRRGSPAERLKIVLTWTPDGCQGVRPFEVLDRLYTGILLAAKNAYEAVDTHHGRDFLLLFRAHHINPTRSLFDLQLNYPVDHLSGLLCLEPKAEENILSDLRSLVALERDGNGALRLHVYHKSFSDFLDAESRAKALFVSDSRVVTHLTKCCMRQIVECPLDFDSLPAKWEELPLPVYHRHSLQRAIWALPSYLNRATAVDGDVAAFTRNSGWQKLNDLLPLVFLSGQFFSSVCGSWIRNLGGFAGKLKTRNPGVAATISEFIEKWKRDIDLWKWETANRARRIVLVPTDFM